MDFVMPPSPKAAIEEQRRLAKMVVFENIFTDNIEVVAGVDVAYSRAGAKALATAGIVLLKFPELTVLSSVSARVPVSFPYIPGLLSYRELPAIVAAAEKLKMRPDLWLVDGAGIAHPRGLGLAAHLGILLDIPTIGVAKSRLIGEHEEVPAVRGSRVPLWLKGEQIGWVLRSRTNVRPLYISPGSGVSMRVVPEIVMSNCIRYRLPEPTRQAHNFVTRIRRERGETGKIPPLEASNSEINVQ